MVTFGVDLFQVTSLNNKSALGLGAALAATAVCLRKS